MNFGTFITPFHRVGQSLTTALEYELEGTVALDRLGFDEAWFGEHRSGGYELIACPEVSITAAAESGREAPDCKDWRVLGIVHLADTREQAIDHRHGRTLCRCNGIRRTRRS